jgi:beta-lactamase class A
MTGKAMPKRTIAACLAIACATLASFYLAVFSLVALSLGVAAAGQTAPPPPSEKQQVLWIKLEKSILDVDRNLDGVMGVAVVDLTDGHRYLLHANDVFPQASSIKICVLVELYRQAQQGKLKLTDLYTVNAGDLVQDSDIMGDSRPTSPGSRCATLPR